MVSIGVGEFAAIAIGVFAVWRIAVWRSAAGDAAREIVVIAFFAYVLAMACVTFFPMTVIFYDWHGRFNLVPLASISDLIRHTSRATALNNIGGNIVMFVPLGVLLPLLSRKLRSLGSLIWRVALISAAIEILQLLTRVRATDVDDVILNVVGAAIGYAVFRLVVLATQHTPGASALLDRVGSDTQQREPLRTALVPVVVTILLTLCLIVPRVLTGTLDEGAISRDALSGMAGASVAARADANEHVVLVAASGETASEAYRYTVYKRVLPGRYTRTSWSDVFTGEGSRYTLSTTAYNPRVGDVPRTYIVGRNDSGATTLVVTAKDGRNAFRAAVGRYFAVALPLGVGFEDADVAVTFRASDDRDVTKSFKGD